MDMEIGSLFSLDCLIGEHNLFIVELCWDVLNNYEAKTGPSQPYRVTNLPLTRIETVNTLHLYVKSAQATATGDRKGMKNPDADSERWA